MYRLKKSTDYLKHLLTMINVLSSSVINGIAIPFPFDNMDQNYSTVQNSTQLQAWKIFPYNSIDL